MIEPLATNKARGSETNAMIRSMIISTTVGAIDYGLDEGVTHTEDFILQEDDIILAAG